MYKLIDSHAHLSTPDLASELDELLERAKSTRIETIINICTNPQEVAAVSL